VRQVRRILRHLQGANFLSTVRSCHLRNPVRVLLGINCAFGNHDIGALPFDALDLEDPANAWHTFGRPKTGEPRLCRLWPRTVESLRRVIGNRPEARNPADCD
jgi:hypothetical protein